MTSSHLQRLTPEGWSRGRGYSHGVLAQGSRVVHVAGQVGWDPRSNEISADLVQQWDRALSNIRDVLETARATVHDIVFLRVFVTDMDAYRANAEAIGEVFRRQMENHYPAMTLVEVASLVPLEAGVEIEATAML